MRVTASYPAYYCPPGVALPDHCGWRGLVGPAQIVAQSPDGEKGMYYGPDYDATSQDAWDKTEAGWWILWKDARPEHFARIRTMPGKGIEGAQEGQRWLIPQLLRWDPETMLACAVDEIHQAGKWETPAHLTPILESLRAVALHHINPIRVVTDPEVVDLVMAIIGLNYHISIVEMDLGRWLTTGFIQRVLRMAMGEHSLSEAMDAMQAKLSA